MHPNRGTSNYRLVGFWRTLAPRKRLADQEDGLLTNRKSVVLIAAACLTMFAGFSGTRAMAQDQKPELTNKKVNLNLENADLRYALKLLFTSAGVNYTLDQAVQGSVTVALTD